MFIKNIFSSYNPLWVLSLLPFFHQMLTGLMAFANDDSQSGNDDNSNNQNADENQDDQQQFRQDIEKIKQENPAIFQQLANYFIGIGKKEAQKQVSKQLEQATAEKRRLLNQLKEMQSNFAGTQAEKEALQKRIDELEEQVLSKEELAKKRFEEAKRKQEEELKKFQTESQRWRQQFENHLIETKILEAASKEETRAFNPRQIVDLLRHRAFVTEEIDDSGNPTGKMVVKLRLFDDELGKEVELDFDEGWKKWAERKENDNLFRSRLAPGSDFGPPADILQGEIPEAALRDPNLYQKYRDKILNSPIGGK
ncbi:hypothetical protein D6827_03520 [Candidatus Parcubacteria bacterium]|nr:MAG: hypothetical protein D6827_03520 [Candidatus Parcubacteria bacterium]